MTSQPGINVPCVSFFTQFYSIYQCSYFTAPVCNDLTSATASGQLLHLDKNNSPGTNNTNYTFTFTATTVLSTIRFAFKAAGDNDHNWYLDNVSVRDNTSNIELLINGGFESGDLTGWTEFCADTCQTSRSGEVTNSTNCAEGTYCYFDFCNGQGNFISQAFSTVVGRLYVIQFTLKQSGPAGTGPQQFYATIN